MQFLQTFLRRLLAVVDGGAAFLLVIIAGLTFTAVIMRYVMAMALPGSFEVGRLLLGVAVFWGIAAATYRREHVTVDLFWLALPAPLRRAVDVFADLVFAGFAGLLTWAILNQVMRVHGTGETTFDLSIPLWPFYAVAWIGLVLCFAILVLRVVAGILGHRIAEGQRVGHDA
jgi:TRAP-type C4-dicarboxylate transport system permease small subunit